MLNPTIGRFLSEDPAEDDPNQYRHVRNNPVNDADPSGLWTEEGVVRAYERVFKDSPEAMAALFIVLSHFELEQADYWADDYGPPDFERGVIPIARTAWFGSERSNENAADQLYEVMWRYFPELGLPRTWSRLAYDLPVGATKTAIGGVGAVVLGAGAVVDPEPVTKVAAAGGAVVSADFAVEGVTQMIGTGGAGGISLIQEAAGWYGRTVAGEEGEITARRAMGVAQFAFGLAGGLTKSNIGTTKFQSKNLRGSLADLKAAGIQDLQSIRSGSQALQAAFKRYKARFLEGLRTGPIRRVGTPRSGVKEVPIRDLEPLHVVPRPGKPANYIDDLAAGIAKDGYNVGTTGVVY
jgi:hypothetical protein